MCSFVTYLTVQIAVTFLPFSEGRLVWQKLKLVINIYAVNKKGISCRKQGVSWTKIAFLFKCSYFSCLLLHLVQKAKFPCSKKVRAILRSLFCFVLFLCTGGACAKKKLHKALRSVQFLASFTSSYFEILSYLAYGEKIIRLASKNSVKLDEKSAGDF